MAGWSSPSLVSALYDVLYSLTVIQGRMILILVILYGLLCDAPLFSYLVSQSSSPLSIMALSFSVPSSPSSVLVLVIALHDILRHNVLNELGYIERVLDEVFDTLCLCNVQVFARSRYPGQGEG